MALLNVDLKSETLKRTVPINVILPVEKFRGDPRLVLLGYLYIACTVMVGL